MKTASSPAFVQGRHSMPVSGRGRNPLLTVVGSDNAAKPDEALDWSALMARAQDGDRDAYRALLEDIAPYLRSLARRYFRQPAEAEDAVQDVLLAIHMVRHAYDPARPFGPWLVAVANRRLIDRLRRQTRRHAREMEFSSEHETFAAPAANLDVVAREAALSDAIEKLPPDQRDAIRMLKLNEMSLKEAAAASGRSVAALKVATHRAVKTLRRLLRQQDA
jgi:RNA polymerase sigma-70 factor (ECF subfamily)